MKRRWRGPASSSLRQRSRQPDVLAPGDELQGEQHRDDLEDVRGAAGRQRQRRARRAGATKRIAKLFSSKSSTRLPRVFSPSLSSQRSSSRLTLWASGVGDRAMAATITAAPGFKPAGRGQHAFSLCRLLSKAFVLREERVMRGRGRSVLSFVFACALIGALAPAAGAHQAPITAPRSAAATSTAAGSSRSSTARTSPTPPAPTPTPPTRATTTARGARVDLPHDWSIELDPTPDGHDQRHRLLPGRPGLVPQDLHAPALGRGQERLARVRRRLHGLRRLPQRQAGRQPPLRLHRLRGRPDGRARRRPHQERRRRRGPQQAPQQPLVLRQRHLPQRPPRRHRPGARRAPRRRS